MDKLSIEAIMDLFFIYHNWNNFYKRGDSFRYYLKNNMPISRSYAYDIIRAIKLLIEYHQKVSSQWTLLDIENSIESTGIKKLRLISHLRNKENKYKILKKVLSGKDVSESEIKKLNKKLIKTIEKTTNNFRIEIENDVLFLYADGGKSPVELLRFNKAVNKKMAKIYSDFKKQIKQTAIDIFKGFTEASEIR